jgi:radical SAM superfamily enzyme YgiQ (UPF0313 family)
VNAQVHGNRERPLLLLLINPRNARVKLHDKTSRWNKYRVWKPLGLLVLAGLTPESWDITVVDENVDTPDYSTLPRPDLVGVTAFTSQAPRAYEVAARFRKRGIPVVMGGIHATFRAEEARGRVDAVVTGEAESVWGQVLEDAAAGKLEPVYHGELTDMVDSCPARHDLLREGYYFGSIQTTRGCPLDCSFCSVSAFNGRTYRRRPIADVVAEFATIPERFVLVVDDNLIGTRRDHVARAKDLFRAMIDADLGKRWFCQATINMADDEELLSLAREAGCIGVFVGFESITAEGLNEVHKKYNLQKGRDFRESVRRIQRHHITVAGSFILGLDVDREGVGHRIAETARGYGLDFLNVLYLTPLPGTRLGNAMEDAGGPTATDFPDDWQSYTLNHPVIRHGHLSPEQIRDEMRTCTEEFYSWWGVASRVLRNVWLRCEPKLTLAGNLSFRVNGRASREPGAGLEPILADAGEHAEAGGGSLAVRTRPSSAGHASSLLDQSSARSS